MISKWVTRNKASVMHFDIQVEVLIKEQLDEAVKWLAEHDYCYEWDCVVGDSLTPTKYSLRVQDMSWAHNVEQFANVLVKSDYMSDVEEEAE